MGMAHQKEREVDLRSIPMAPYCSEKGDDGGGTSTGSRWQSQATPTDPQRREGGQAGKAEGVKAGHKGRARRGIEKEGGYYPTKRRKTTHTTEKEKGTAQKKQVDDGSGRGRVALENTIVVGRVYIQRMERKGKNRRDAGRPPGEPG